LSIKTDNNPSNKFNNINVTRRADLYKNKLYDIKSDFLGNRNDDYRYFLSIFHKNIRELREKLMCSCILKGNVNIFRQTLKNFLISNAFYLIDEYISSKHV
jgi:hypothetical protein